jgi:hypothetical protein
MCLTLEKFRTHSSGGIFGLPLLIPTLHRRRLALILAGKLTGSVNAFHTKTIYHRFQGLSNAFSAVLGLSQEGLAKDLSGPFYEKW